MSSRLISTQVMIVGGGIVGLSAGLFLQQLGVPFILVEKREQPSVLPRSRGLHVRTMELFRQLNIYDRVKEAAEAAWKQGTFGGARRGCDMLSAESLPLTPITTKPNPESPCSFGACPQTILEPILRETLEQRGGDTRFGWRLISFCEANDGIRANLRDPFGQETELAAQYLIGADGGNGGVRKALSIPTEDTPPLNHFANIFFRADLAREVRGRTFSQCEIDNASVRGLFLSNNNANEWSLHIAYEPTVASPIDLPETELAELVGCAIGSSDVSIEVLGKSLWNDGVRIATKYRSGRCFLAGDAAHLMPPWGGFNGNTGIADVHNLAWKLAAVLDSTAPDDLLDSYEVERRPIAVRNGQQARLRTDFDARFDIRTEVNRHFFAQLQETGALLLRYSYPTDELQPPASSVVHLQAQIGTRFPHAWIIRDGIRLSTLDLFGQKYVLMCGPDAAMSKKLSPGYSGLSRATYVSGVDFEFVDADFGWSRLTGLGSTGTILVRPDGHVALRSES